MVLARVILSVGFLVERGLTLLLLILGLINTQQLMAVSIVVASMLAIIHCPWQVLQSWVVRHNSPIR
jgi:ABC-type amino acid transport system permease subunit